MYLEREELSVSPIDLVAISIRPGSMNHVHLRGNIMKFRCLVPSSGMYTLGMVCMSVFLF